ncbi:MAG: hypothetical protein AAGD01_11450 [Acidobacteriota bacterium]
MEVFRLDTAQPRDFPPQLRALHRRQGQAAVDWLRFARRNPETLDRAEFGYTRDSLDNYLYGAIHPWPLFIDEQRQQDFAAAAVSVSQLIESVPTRLFGDDPVRLSEALCLDQDLTRISVEYRLRYPDAPLWSRADFYDTASGLRCLELNTSSFLGGWQDAIWRPYYLQHPLIRRFLDEYGYQPTQGDESIAIVFHGLVQRAVDAGFAEGGQLNLFMGMDEEDMPEIRFNSQDAIGDLWSKTLTAVAPGVEGQVTLAPVMKAQADEKGLFYGGEPQHIMLEFYSTLSPPSVLQALDAGRLHLCNGPANIILRSKLHLAWLWEHADRGDEAFTAEERDQILRFLPWSIIPRRGAKVRFRGEFHDVSKLLLQRREDFVIKRGSSFAGQGVHVGRFVEDAEWQQHVEQALSEPGWMVQERIDSVPLLFQNGEHGAVLHDSAWGIFAFGPRYGGSFLRIQPMAGAAPPVSEEDGLNRGLINTSQGARECAIIAVEPRIASLQS